MAARLYVSALLLLCTPLHAADDFKVNQLEQDVRELQRQVRAQSQLIEELRSRLSRPNDPLGPVRAPAARPEAAQWVDAASWEKLKAGMSELEVIGLLGPPTSMREEQGTRTLFYAMEIGRSGFLGGSVEFRDRAVATIRKPVLQ